MTSDELRDEARAAGDATERNRKFQEAAAMDHAQEQRRSLLEDLLTALHENPGLAWELRNALQSNAE